MIGIALHLGDVIRFLILLLTSLSLALTPAAAASAPAGMGATQAACSMAEAEMDMGTGGDHDNVGCCTPQCMAPAPAAVLGPNDLGAEISPQAGSRLLFPRETMLLSLSPAATDPPPRLHLT